MLTFAVSAIPKNIDALDVALNKPSGKMKLEPDEMHTRHMTYNRRRFIQSVGLVAAPSILTPAALAAINNAAVGGTPRIGLVIGNSNYPDNPLKNPSNDAKAIADSMSGLGFNLKLLVDAGLTEMTQAVGAYAERLAKEKAVGFFYYAGHGVQLAWRNFLIPVDANIAQLDDIPRKAFELNALLGGLTKASNPMNIIVLDACRDNPFGTRVLAQQKGLSQFDAPPGSFLAYATSPGNTASDGGGSNGLFTENFLREMRRPDARIEDVFKRVRLNVRLESRGQQVPWESTSLEDDFYFVPQGRREKDSREERDARSAEERKLWDEAAASADPKLTEAYIKRYPSGVYSELAQGRLDRLLAASGEKKVQVVSHAANPFSKGSASGTGKYAVGDTFTYSEREPASGAVLRSFTERVTAVDAFSTTFDDGQKVIDLTGNETRSPVPRFLSPAQFYPAEYVVGQKWKTKFGWLAGNGRNSEMELDFQVIERKTVTLPAGSFNAFVVVANGFVLGGGTWRVAYQIDPDKCARPIAFEMIGRGRGGGWDAASYRIELAGFKQRNVG